MAEILRLNFGKDGHRPKRENAKVIHENGISKREDNYYDGLPLQVVINEPTGNLMVILSPDNFEGLGYHFFDVKGTVQDD